MMGRLALSASIKRVLFRIPVHLLARKGGRGTSTAKDGRGPRESLTGQRKRRVFILEGMEGAMN